MISVDVIIPSGCIPAEKKALYYYLSYADRKVMLTDRLIFYFDLDIVHEEGFDAFREKQTLKFRCIPGEYAIFGAWDIGQTPQRLGTINVSSDDDGQTLELSVP